MDKPKMDSRMQVALPANYKYKQRHEQRKKKTMVQSAQFSLLFSYGQSEANIVHKI